MSVQRKSSLSSTATARYPLPVSLRDLRTDSTTNFDFLLQQKPSLIDEERIQRLIEDKMLMANQTKIESKSSPIEKPHPPTTLPESLPAALPSSISESSTTAFSLVDAIPFVQHGFDKLVEDDFSRCFQSARSPPWNWNFYLYPLWLCGVFIRFGILLPMRFGCLIFGFIIWSLMLLCIKFIVPEARRGDWERWGIRFLCSCFVFSWTGVIRYHGRIAPHRPNQIYVANHTSLIDIIILQQWNTFSMVGQRQKGFVGFFQKHILSCLNNCFFDRAEAQDRAMAAKKIKAHIANPTSNRLLIFPEGTCVNNEYCVQFKQGAFDMNAEVIPIAIKYNKIFVDAFWNSRAQAFPMHLLTLMTSWAVVCDVWYLHPTSKRENESPIEFSERVKKQICDRAGLKNVNWDGYLKHFRPSQRYSKEQQQRVANSILQKWQQIQGIAQETENSAAAAADDDDQSEKLTSDSRHDETKESISPPSSASLLTSRAAKTRQS